MFIHKPTQKDPSHGPEASRSRREKATLAPQKEAIAGIPTMPEWASGEIGINVVL